MPHSKIKGKGYSLSPRDSALPCILCPPLLHLKPLPCIFCPPLLHLKPNKPQSYAHSLIKSRAVGRFFVFLVMLAELVWGVWKQIWWTACPRLYSAQAPAGTAAWLTALRSATHLPDCCRVGVKEIWNAWDPDCFIAGLSEPLYGLVLLGFAISPRLGGVTFAALNIKRQHHTIYISSFYLAERKREGERKGKRKKRRRRETESLVSLGKATKCGGTHTKRSLSLTIQNFQSIHCSSLCKTHRFKYYEAYIKFNYTL